MSYIVIKIEVIAFGNKAEAQELVNKHNKKLEKKACPSRNATRYTTITETALDKLIK